MTQPLSEDFTTDGDKLLALADAAYKTADHPDFKLDEWQRDLIRRVLETYPQDWPDASLRGKLRYRQVVISLGRQNGKSELAAIFGLYGITLHGAGPNVISLASTKEQADIVYGRVKYCIDANPALTRRYKTTGTRGIKSRNASKPAS